MDVTIEAVYDGTVFRPLLPVKLKPNTRVRLVLTEESEAPKRAHSFLDIASQLNLEGPEDWSAKIEDYLYGHPDERRD